MGKFCSCLIWRPRDPEEEPQFAENKQCNLIISWIRRTQTLSEFPRIYCSTRTGFFLPPSMVIFYQKFSHFVWTVNAVKVHRLKDQQWNSRKTEEMLPNFLHHQSLHLLQRKDKFRTMNTQHFNSIFILVKSPILMFDSVSWLRVTTTKHSMASQDDQIKKLPPRLIDRVWFDQAPSLILFSEEQGVRFSFSW